MLVPTTVPLIYANMYLPAFYTAIIVGFFTCIAITMQKRDIHVLILTDLIGFAMIIVVAGVGTDLAESFILPGLVVELAEIMAISEILISREMRKISSNQPNVSFAPMPMDYNMEILTTAPNFLSLILLAYGVFLTGFTGGAVAGGGILLYILSRKARGLPVLELNGISGISGLGWCMWIISFWLFFTMPQYWLLCLFLAACGLLLKVATKMGLIGVLMREDFGKK
ncbi:EhaG family protein [uncultured Methanobrevibacter sp.]|uniref:EhaG family protein n=1 Tax=uncultured Methanobrevibacter sp. TaxID=253161 RepID=UPI00258B11A4|nr:EhaG family protein [uncultured Methanobrevibacter sp.]